MVRRKVSGGGTTPALGAVCCQDLEAQRRHAEHLGCLGHFFIPITQPMLNTYVSEMDDSFQE